MKPSVKSELAVRVAVDIARFEQNGFVALSSVSERQRVSMSYLESIVARLCLHGVLASKRGPAGGYRPARPCELISVADIVRAVDDHCEENIAGHENKANPDAAAEVWSSANAYLWSCMGAITLANLVERRQLAAEAVECAARPPKRTLSVPRRRVARSAAATTCNG